MKTYPLLQSQLGVLLQSMKHPHSTLYNLPNYFFMPLSLTRQRVVSAVEKLIQTFPELHTRYVTDDQGELRQWSDMSMLIPVVSRKSTEEELQAYINSGFVRPFSPMAGEPLFRVEVVETEQRICLLSDGHHSIVDAMTYTPTLTSAFVSFIEGGSYEPQPYGMYQAAEDEVASFGTEAYQRAKNYYAEKFADVKLTALSSRMHNTMGKMGRRSAFVSRTQCDAWCQEHGLPVNLLFQAAFSHVIGALTRQDSVAYFTVNHGRMDKRLRNSVGMFVKSVPFLADGSGDPTVTDYIRRLRTELVSTVRHGIYPFTHFCIDLNMTPGVMFNFLALADLEERLLLGDAEFSVVQPVREEMDNDAGVLIFLKGDQYEIRVESSLAMNDEPTLQMLADAIRCVIGQMLDHPDFHLSQISIVSSEEQAALVQLGAGKRLDTGTGKTYMDYFLARAATCPDALAVADDTGTLSYSQLDRYSDLIAQRLLSAGVAPRDFVGVMIERTRAFPVSVFGIHKAGAAYLPLDPEYPSARLSYMLEDSGTRVLITTHAVLSAKQADGSFFDGELIFLDDIDWEQESAACKPVNRCVPDGYTYIIYTSGSTGRPKGAVLHQKGLLSYILSTAGELGLTADDRISSHRSFSFDSHIEDMYGILLLGGSLHIMPEGIRKDLTAIVDFIARHHVTGGGYTTSVAKLLVNNFDLPVRYISAAGERLTGVVSRNCDIFNFYGPTECTDHISAYRLERGRDYVSIPIGHVVANNWCFIVDSHDRLLPRGAVGELCIAGIQVGIGYWQRPELTAEKFCDCQFVTENVDGSPVRMYHTGDLCRWNADGELEYIGRIDNQVKVRGFRIELGEIESCASRFEGITQAVAVVKSIGGSDTLCLYYTANYDIDKSALRIYFEQSLTEYMVPTAYMQLDTMPQLPNGKTDRRHLPEPVIEEEIIVAPQTDLERQLLAVVASHLGMEHIGVTTNLIRLGLTSLSAMRLVMSIRQETGITLPVRELLDDPTVRRMAELAQATQVENGDVLFSYLAPRAYYPLTENQRGVYIDWELNRGTTQYNMPTAFRLGQRDAQQLAAALREAVDAHSYLKMRLAVTGGDVVQQRRDDAAPVVTITELAQAPDQSFFQSRVRPFDLFSEDLYRLELYTCQGSTWLFRDFHHIVSDGLTDSIFFNDVLAACSGAQLQKEEVTTFEYALYEQDLKESAIYADAREYFDTLLDGAEVASLPHSSRPDGNAGSNWITFAVAGSDVITAYCRRMAITPNTYFQTVVSQVLHRLTRQDHLMLATVSNGRFLSQTEHMAGMFIRTIPVVSMADTADGTFVEAAGKMHRQSLDSMSRDFYPLTELVERHGLRPEILYVYEGGLYDGLNLGESQEEDTILLNLDTQKLPIELIVYPDSHGSYTIHLSYDTARYSRSDMQTLAEALSNYAAGASVDGIKLKDIELVTPEQHRALVQLGAGKHLVVDTDKTFVTAFEEVARQLPDNIAVADGTNSMTYGELSRRSNVLAHRMIACGVRPDDFVAVRLGRTIAFPLTVIAIYKAGAAYIPIDPEYPEERQQYMLVDSQARLVVDDRFVADTDFSEEAAPIDLSVPTGLAYMIYTSGSTGKPKGAMLHQAGLWNFISAITDIERLSVSDRIGCHSSFSFDAHVEDLFPILTVGGSSHIMPAAIRKDMTAMRDFLFEQRVTGIGLTTSLAMLMVDTYDDLPVRFLTAGGERLGSVFSDHLEIINTYGPTECTVDATYYIIRPGCKLDPIPIGRPLANCYSFVVDPLGRLLPRGAIGELCFAGIQVGSGYWQQPELTAERFVSCPFLPGKTTMYHTGDLCRWNADGELEYLGRIDNQVKLRGFRIELGEVESCACHYEGIRQAVASVSRTGGDDMLCLYYVADQDVDKVALRDYLSRQLADYMVPVAYMQLDRMPQLPNGKIDRRHLPEAELTLHIENVAPTSEKESFLLMMARQILDRSDFGTTDDLIALGLTSIGAIKLAAMAAAAGVKVRVNNLMRQRTIVRAIGNLSEPCYWFNVYSPEKPVLVVPHGIIYAINMAGKLNRWQQYFSIYTIEPTDEHAERLFPDGDFQSVIDTYAKILDRDIPVGAHVFAFVGYSWGGEQAYWLARRWYELRGDSPNVYLGDSHIHYNDSTEMSEETIASEVAAVASRHQIDLLTVDQSVMQAVQQLVVRKAGVVERLQCTDPFPAYEGHVTLFNALKENLDMEHNLEEWHRVASRLKVVDVNDNHLNFLFGEQYIDIVSDEILGDLKKDERAAD